MDSPLDAIVAADEEARARLASKEAEIARRLAAARDDAERRRESERSAIADALSREIDTIESETAREIAERARRRDERVAALERSAEIRFQEAVERFTTIIRQGRLP